MSPCRAILLQPTRMLFDKNNPWAPDATNRSHGKDYALSPGSPLVFPNAVHGIILVSRPYPQIYIKLHKTTKTHYYY